MPVKDGYTLVTCEIQGYGGVYITGINRDGSNYILFFNSTILSGSSAIQVKNIWLKEN